MSEVLLRFENVSKIYPSGSSHLTILEELNFSIEAMSSVAVVGKVALERVLSSLSGALDRPTSGRVLFEGDDIGKMGDKELFSL